MKKKIVGAVLVGLVVRLAVLAGAGEALGAWVRDIGTDGRLVSAALSIGMGGHPLPDTAETEPDAETDTAAETDAADAPSAQSTLLLVPVRPGGMEEAVNLGETAEAEVKTVAADLSSDSKVHNSSGLDIDIAAIAAEGLTLRLQPDQPQVLIIHTHSSEAYTQDDVDRYEESDPYRTEDRQYSVIRVGDELCSKLTDCGLTVVHDREIYDYPSYTGSYSRSGAAAEEWLKEYPSIRIVIDLHRDALGSGDVVYKTQADLSGKSSAQVMLLVGTGAGGLYHPYWQENLKLALYMQNAMDARYPTLARPVELVKERYNQQLSTGSMILEVGSSGNTLREALQAVELFGDAVGPALAELIET